MLNVFSDNQKMSDRIRLLQQCVGSIYTRILLTGPEDEPLYMLKPKAIFVLTWINKRILFELPKVKDKKNAQWIGVRIRIATSMLNKLVDDNIISKEMCIEYHNRLVTNIRKILGEIYTEDLPF